MGLFDPDHKTKLHIVVLIIVVAVMAASGVRILMAEMPMTRADTMALGAGAKSLLIIGYQLLSEHVKLFRRIHSLKANMVLNIIECVFWGAVAGLVVQSNLRMCTSGTLLTSCWISWGVAGGAALICLLSIYATILSCKQHRHEHHSHSHHKRLSDVYEDVHPLSSIPPVPTKYESSVYQSPVRHNY